MLRIDMALESLMFSEGLVAWRVCGAAESVMTDMCILMSLKSGRGKETLSTSLVITFVRSFVGV